VVVAADSEAAAVVAEEAAFPVAGATAGEAVPAVIGDPNRGSV
jgi:hypothetical protein